MNVAVDSTRISANETACTDKLACPSSSTQVSVTPTAEGVYFISVFTEQAGRVSAVSLPVQVGKAGVKLEKPGQTTTLPNGERAVIMPSS